MKAQHTNRLVDAVNEAALASLDETSEVGRAIRYHLSASGKFTRTHLTLTVAERAKLDVAIAMPLALCVELLHNASLLHDDIQDRDTYRRGQPATWVVFGPEISLCAGDVLISAAYRQLAELPADFIAEAMKLVHEQVATTIKGQGRDCQPQSMRSFDDYLLMATEKSAPLFSLAVELVLLCSQRAFAIPLARSACESFALGYQISDDLDDLQTDEHTSNAVQNWMRFHDASMSEARYQVFCTSRACYQRAIHVADKLPDQIGDPLKSLAQGQLMELNSKHGAQYIDAHS